MEIVDVKSARGLAKIAGTAVSFAGVTTMTLYKGAAITSPWKAPIRIPSGEAAATHDGWLKGALLAVASCVCWSIWYIMQVRKNYTVTSSSYRHSVMHSCTRERR